MNIVFAGHEGSGVESLALSVASLRPGDNVRALTFPDTADVPNADALVLVVNLLEGPMPGTREALRVASRQGWRLLGFLLTRDDEFDTLGAHGPHIKELVEMEARELASAYGYRDEALPALRVSIPADAVALNAFLE